MRMVEARPRFTPSSTDHCRRAAPWPVARNPAIQRSCHGSRYFDNTGRISYRTVVPSVFPCFQQVITGTCPPQTLPDSRRVFF